VGCRLMARIEGLHQEGRRSQRACKLRRFRDKLGTYGGRFWPVPVQKTLCATFRQNRAPMEQANYRPVASIGKLPCAMGGDAGISVVGYDACNLRRCFGVPRVFAPRRGSTRSAPNLFVVGADDRLQCRHLAVRLVCQDPRVVAPSMVIVGFLGDRCPVDV